MAKKEGEGGAKTRSSAFPLFLSIGKAIFLPPFPPSRAGLIKTAGEVESAGSSPSRSVLYFRFIFLCPYSYVRAIKLSIAHEVVNSACYYLVGNNFMEVISTCCLHENEFDNCETKVLKLWLWLAALGLNYTASMFIVGLDVMRKTSTEDFVFEL